MMVASRHDYICFTGHRSIVCQNAILSAKGSETWRRSLSIGEFLRSGSAYAVQAAGIAIILQGFVDRNAGVFGSGHAMPYYYYSSCYAYLGSRPCLFRLEHATKYTQSPDIDGLTPSHCNVAECGGDCSLLQSLGRGGSTDLLAALGSVTCLSSR